MSTDPKTPKWRVIADELRRRIREGEYPPDSTLPQIKAYAAKRDVHHETVRVAYKALEAEGLIRSVKRRGSVVLERPDRRRITRGRRVTRDPDRGYIFPAAAHPGEPWQVHGRPFRSFVSAPEKIAIILGAAPGTELLRRRRVTSPQGEPPFQLVDTWISEQGVSDAPRVADASPGAGGYMDRLEEAGHGPLTWEETITARMPDKEEATLLQISTSTPVIETVIVGTSAQTNAPIEATVRVIPSDRVELAGDLVRGDGAEWPVSPIAPTE
jgi:GntR family transcriptional regulator